MARRKRLLERIVSTPVRRRLLTLMVGAVLGGLVTWGGLAERGQRGAQAPVSVPDPLSTPADRYAWSELPAPAFPIPPYARFLADVTIVLDPGHVGQRDPGGTWKRGPTGLREAAVNLRVAQYLREFLTAVGARVVLTREVDESLDLPDDVDLSQRAAIANEAGAELLLSIHHNAAENPAANYTTVYYHDDGEDSPASLCAARHVLTGLDEALRLEDQVGCALRSDKSVVRNGFAVLRYARVPAVLTEASFHSNPQEEERLRDPVYNRREAYGLFLGLARWAQAGLPTVRLVQPADGRARAGGELVIAVDDGLSARGGAGADHLRILPQSVVVELDGRPLQPTLDAGKRQVRVKLPRGARGRCTLWVDFANVFGQHPPHPRIGLEVGG